MQNLNPERRHSTSQPQPFKSATCSPSPKYVERTSVKNSWSHLIAGASGGMASALLTSPLDVLRTRLQSDFYRSQLIGKRPLHPPASLGSSHFLRMSMIHIYETFQILFSIHRIEGWRGHFRGLGPNLTGIVPATAIKFYTYALIHVGAAATAGIVTGLTTNPIWLVKTRMQLDRSQTGKLAFSMNQRYKNSIDCLVQVFRQEGIRGMYRGLGASFLGVAESTLHLTLYEQMKILLAKRREKVLASDGSKTNWDDALDWGGMSGAAGVSKLIAVSIGYPHEVVRTRLRQAPLQDGRLKYTSLTQCFRVIWKEEGLIAFYGGLTAHLLRSVPSAAITLGVYEFVLRHFGSQA